MFKPIFVRTDGSQTRGNLIGYDFFRKPYQVQIESTPVDLGEASVNLIQHNGLVYPRRLSTEETQAMFDSIDKGAPNVDVASFLFGLINGEKHTNISVAPMDDAEPVEGILYCYGEDNIVVSRDGNESVEFDNAVDAIQAACAAALDPKQKLSSVRGKENALAIMRDVLADMVPRRPHQLMVGPLTFADPYAHLKDFARHIFSPQSSMKKYNKELKETLMKLLVSDAESLKAFVEEVNKQNADINVKRETIRNAFQESTIIQNLLIKSIREIDNSTLMCMPNKYVDNKPYNSYYRVVWPLCR